MSRPVRRAGGPTGWRRLFRRLLAAGAGLMVGLLAAEVAVRFFRPQAVPTVNRIYQTHPPGRYCLLPSTGIRQGNAAEYSTLVRTNRLGLRGPEPPPPGDGRPRILFVGDSFTFGMGVEEEETFVVRVGEELDRRGHRVVTLNGGVPGYNLVDIAGWVERHGLGLEPDVVVLAAYMGNDLQDSDPESAPIAVVDHAIGFAGRTENWSSWLLHHSHLAVLAGHGIPAPVQAPIRRMMGLPEPVSRILLREEASLYAIEPDAHVQRGVGAAEAALSRLAELTSAHGIRLAAVLIPHRIQTDPAEFARTLEELGLDTARYDARSPDRIFSRLFASVRVPVLDLREPFARDVARGLTLYYRIDKHWTAEGHGLGARLIGDFLLEQRLVSDPPVL